ncbi:ComF family protein [Candidatus Microgenomates bacterium]|nr:MAG: ComF family protein [Candidatus Microgenomates bacterium]
MGKTHAICSGKTAFEQKLALWKYDGIVRKAILALKYRFASDVAEELACVVSNELKNLAMLPARASLVPVPLHTKREKWRGFNQSAMLGQTISKEMGWSFCDRLLVRVAHAIPQVKLDKKERMQNIRGKFAVNTNTLRAYRDENTILFDDVWTTGATMNEAAWVLNKAGIRSISGLAIAAT